MTNVYKFTQEAIDEATVYWGNYPLPSRLSIVGLALVESLGFSAKRALILDADSGIYYTGKQGILIAQPGGF